MARTKPTVEVKKAGTLLTPEKKPSEKKSAPKRTPRKKPTLVPPVDTSAIDASPIVIATDHIGRQYRFDPTAKVPFSGHSIIYPDQSDLDEDIPLQHGREDMRGVNGASPFLLIHAATHALARNKTRLPYKAVAVQYLRAALGILQADEDFLSALQASKKEVTPKCAEDRFIIANAHLQYTQQRVEEKLIQAIGDLMLNVDDHAAQFIDVESDSLREFKSVIPVVITPTS